MPHEPDQSRTTDILTLLRTWDSPVDPDNIRESAAREIERLRAEVHDLGRLSDTCTYHALGKVCGYCECKRKAPKNSP